MVSKPEVTIVIPTYNRKKSLARCLESLTNQTYKNFEVVIADGGSTDGTRELLYVYSDKLSIKYTVQKGGLVAQENEGWRISAGYIVIRTDDDIIASPEWINEIVRVFSRSDRIGGVTGPTIIPEEQRKFRDLFFFEEKMRKGNVFWRLIGRIYFDYFLEGKPFVVGKWFRSGAFSLGSNYPECLRLNEPVEVHHHEACNMAIKKELLERIGGFDETFIGIGEYSEPDVSFKIRNMGYKIIFNPAARVLHLPSKEGFFRDRPDAYGRVLNFINFYFRHIKPDTPDKFLRFFSYLLFLNGFWIYKFLTTGQINQLGCISGTIVGLGRNMFRKSARKTRFDDGKKQIVTDKVSTVKR